VQPFTTTRWFHFIIIIIIIISNLSDDRSTASSKTIPPLNAILSFLLQMREILFCPQGHPAASYVFFLVFLSLLSAPVSFLQ
jgi:hypothetical protein